MSKMTEKEYEQCRSQISALGREWETKEDELKKAISNEEENLHLIQQECLKLDHEQERYYRDHPQLMDVLKQKNEQLNQARYEEEQILEILQQERKNLNNQMENAIDEVRRMMG